MDQDYNRVCRDEIDRHVREHGELSSCVPQWLDREHEGPATEVFVAALPPIPQACDEWDFDGSWEEGPAVPDDAVLTPPEIDALYEAYEPSDSEREEFSRWIHEGRDAVDSVEEMRRWYDSRPAFYDWLSREGGPR